MRNNSLIKNTTMLYIMNIAKMIFPLITLPYLTRVLTKDYYGVVSYVKATMQYMQILVDFGFMLSGTKSIVHARKNPTQLHFEIGDILVARIFMCIVAFIVLVVLRYNVQIIQENFLYSVLSFVVVFLSCFLFDYVFRGLEEMHVITIRFIITRGIATLLTFIFVHSNDDILWIPILDIIGTICAIVLVWYELRKRHITIKTNGVASAIIKLKESFVFFISDMATTAFLALNTIIIGIYLSKTDVALWGVCMQLIGAVLSLYNPISNGIYPYMVKNRDISIIQKTIRIFMPIVTLGCVFTYFSSALALNIISGPEYVQAAPVLRALIPVLFFGFPSVIFGWPVLGAIGKEKENTIVTVGVAIVQIMGLLILINKGILSLMSIALLRGVTECLLFAARYYCYRKNISAFLLS